MDYEREEISAEMKSLKAKVAKIREAIHHTKDEVLRQLERGYTTALDAKLQLRADPFSTADEIKANEQCVATLKAQIEERRKTYAPINLSRLIRDKREAYHELRTLQYMYDHLDTCW